MENEILTDEELAKAHVLWFMGNIRLMLKVGTEVLEKTLVDHFVHGIKHGRELERERKEKY